MLYSYAQEKKGLLSQFFLFSGLVLLSITALQFALLFGISLYKHTPVLEIGKAVFKNTTTESWYEIMAVQAASSMGFSVGALLYMRILQNKNIEGFNYPNDKLKLVVGIVSTIGISLAFLPLSSWLGELNSLIHFPDSFKDIEDKLRRQEQNLETQMLFIFSKNDSFFRLFIMLVVVGFLAAFNEEVVFRGCLQPLFTHKLQNYHIGIWLSAIIFSAIHFQFFGFIPRMILGALFGYLYVWTGKFYVPVLAHFTNNAFIVFLGYQNIDLLKEETKVPLSLVLLSILLTVSFIFWFKKREVIPLEDGNI